MRISAPIAPRLSVANLVALGGAALATLGASAWAQAPSDPKFAEHVRAGLEARRDGRLEEADRELQAAAELAPEMAEVQLTLGEVRHRRRLWLAASRAFEKALRLKPEVEGARALLGLDYLMMGRFDEAIEALTAAGREPKPHPDLDYWLGLAHLERGDFRAAIPRLEAAREAKPGDPDRLFYLARAYQKAATEVQAELLATAPRSARAHLAAAEDHAFNGRAELAIEEYRRAAEADPSLPGVHASIAELSASAGRYEEADESYRKELELSPQNPTVHYRRALVLQQLSRHEQAVEHLRFAVEGDPTAADAWAQLGKSLLQLGRLDEAEAALERALSSEPPPETRRTAHYQLGMLHRQRGDLAKSRVHLAAFEKLRRAAAPTTPR